MFTHGQDYKLEVLVSVLGKKLAEGEDDPADMRMASRSSQGRTGKVFSTKNKERIFC